MYESYLSKLFPKADYYEIELSNESYSYDLLVVVETADGYYLSTDSGCSCPTPWENAQLEDFTGPLTKEQALEECASLIADALGREYGEGPSTSDIVELREFINS